MPSFKAEKQQQSGIVVDVSSLSAYPSLLLRVTNLVGFLVLILVNTASALGYLGRTNGEISAKFETPLTPAGWAFSIWGPIFALEGLGVIYAALPYGYANDGWKQRLVNSIGYSWQLGWYCELAWQSLFQIQTAAGMVACLALLLGSFACYFGTLLRLYRLKDLLGPAYGLRSYVLFFLPTSVNAAWLSVASAVGVTIIPRSYGVTAHMEPLAVGLAALVSVVGIIVVNQERDSAYGLTLVWALTAVYGKQHSRVVKAGSLVCVCGLLLATIFSVLRRRPQPSSSNSASELPIESPGLRAPLNRAQTE